MERTLIPLSDNGMKRFIIDVFVALASLVLISCESRTNTNNSQASDSNEPINLYYLLDFNLPDSQYIEDYEKYLFEYAESDGREWAKTISKQSGESQAKTIAKKKFNQRYGSPEEQENEDMKYYYGRFQSTYVVNFLNACEEVWQN